MKKWLIAFNKNGRHELGSDYSQTTELKTLRSWTKQAERMKKARNTIESVYIISDCQYNQKVCEMEPNQFDEYVKKIGTKLV